MSQQKQILSILEYIIKISDLINDLSKKDNIQTLGVSFDKNVIEVKKDLYSSTVRMKSQEDSGRGHPSFIFELSLHEKDEIKTILKDKIET